MKKTIEIQNYFGLGYVQGDVDNTVDIRRSLLTYGSLESSDKVELLKNIIVGLNDMTSRVLDIMPKLTKLNKYFDLVDQHDNVLVSDVLTEADLGDVMNTNMLTPISMDVVKEVFKPLHYGTHLYNIDVDIHDKYVLEIGKLYNSLRGHGYMFPKDVILYRDMSGVPEYISAITIGPSSNVYDVMLKQSKELVDLLSNEDDIKHTVEDSFPDIDLAVKGAVKGVTGG